MPFHADGAFDAVLDSACLHCLIGPARRRCLAEVRRILRPAGVFVVSSMVGPPRSAEALAGFDATVGHLLKNGTPYRTLKPLEALIAELVATGFNACTHDVAANPWWDHATLICRLPKSIDNLDNGAPYS
jgi:SAM-dependent methyltransferase